MDKQDLIITKASGKVLLAGGYGVLEQNNYGLTLGLQNSFYCVCTQYIPAHPSTDIIVSSYQITQSWKYTTKQDKLQQTENKRNQFVENSLFWVLKYYKKLNNGGLIKLEILFDRNFVSNSYALDQSRFPVYKEGYTKTGLGSSACVVVSIVQCMIMLFDPQLKQKDQSRFYRLANVLSQIANLSAQKKIGSNFDISTAVFGTHLYQNILPHKIAALNQIGIEQIDGIVSVDPQIQLIKAPSTKLYSYIVDINKGADTRVMVKSFLSELKKNSKEIQQQFFSRSKKIALELFSAFNDEQYNNLKQINIEHRKLQQEYSQITGVPIEPKDLSNLINKITGISQVLYGICPGSGGYDAIFVLANQDIQKQLTQAVEENHVRLVQISYTYNHQIKPQQKNWVFSALQAQIHQA